MIVVLWWKRYTWPWIYLTNSISTNMNLTDIAGAFMCDRVVRTCTLSCKTCSMPQSDCLAVFPLSAMNIKLIDSEFCRSQVCLHCRLQLLSEVFNLTHQEPDLQPAANPDYPTFISFNFQTIHRYACNTTCTQSNAWNARWNYMEKERLIDTLIDFPSVLVTYS